jgi:sterol desaturase/sphingolipid hydroxylase (fatty acid hydroxylase superfamily)
MNRLIGLFVALLLLSAIFWMVEALFAANRGQPRGPRRQGFWTDVLYWFATPLVTRSVSEIGLAVLLVLVYRSSPAAISTMLQQRTTGLAAQPLWLQAIEMLVIGDFIAYWMHRWFHGRTMWKFHAVHHCSTQLDWLSSVRLHPVNDWITRWVQASALVLCGFSTLAIAAYVPFLTFYALMLHANVSWRFGRIGWLVASPRFHRWHHTSEDEGLDRNFAGLFPWIDRLFGTWYMPEGRMPERFGLKNETIPAGFFGQMAFPFRPRSSKIP